VRQARAARDRAQANLDLTHRESAADVARARRSFTAGLARRERDRRLLASADRVAAMSLQAYAEGAMPLANVLEAQRSAREALGRYIDDVAATNDAAGVVRLVTASAGEPLDACSRCSRSPPPAAIAPAPTMQSRPAPRPP